MNQLSDEHLENKHLAQRFHNLGSQASFSSSDEDDSDESSEGDNSDEGSEVDNSDEGSEVDNSDEGSEVDNSDEGSEVDISDESSEVDISDESSDVDNSDEGSEVNNSDENSQIDNGESSEGENSVSFEEDNSDKSFEEENSDENSEGNNSGSSEGENSESFEEDKSDEDTKPRAHGRCRLSDNTSPKKKVPKPKGYLRHHPEALQLLKQITEKSATELKVALYKTYIVPREDQDYKQITKYVRNSQDHGFEIEVVHIIRIVRNNDCEFPSQTPNTSHQFRMILWHGTQKQHVASILTNGFLIPPAKNQMFGTGIYFADRVSKSAQYCKAPIGNSQTGSEGYMFLCDVKLGSMYKARKAHKGFQKAPNGYDTVKCSGHRKPDWSQNVMMKGAILPSGETIDAGRFDDYILNYNEYISYDTDRVKAKYLVVVKFHQHPK